MGAGKSSVMDAISFGLFGTFPTLARHRIKLSDIITNRPSKEQSASVKIVFSADGHTYSITRNINQKGADALLEMDGKYMQSQAERVNEEVAAILKLDYQTFSRAVYSEQNNMEYFLELGRGDRKKQIDNMLGLDSFSMAEENAVSLINSIRNMIKSEEAILSKFDLASMHSKLEELESNKSKYDSENASLSESIASLEVSLSKSKSSLDLAKAEFEKRARLVSEISAIKSKVAMLDSEIGKIKALGMSKEELSTSSSKIESSLSALKSGLKTAKDAEKAAMSSLEKAKANLGLAKTSMEEMQKIEKQISNIDGEALSRQISEIENRISSTKDGISTAHAQGRELAKSIEELSKSSGRCPVCDQELTEEHKKSLISSRSAEIDKLKANETELARQVTVLQKEYDSLSNRYKDYELAKKRLADYASAPTEMESAKSLIPSLEGALSKASSEAERLQEEQQHLSEELNSIKHKLEAIKRMEDYAVQRSSLGEELSSKETAIKSINSDEKTVYKLQEELSSISSSLSSKRSTLSGNQKLIAELSRSIESISSQIKEAEKIGKRIEYRRTDLRELTIFRKVLSSVSSSLRDRIVSSINGIMQGMWPELYPYGDYQSLRLYAQEDDYTLQARTPLLEEGWLDVASVASGGERSVACLAMRIALSMVIVPNLKWLILDEPTHNIDSAGISKFVDVLGDVLPSLVEQIFIITHDDSLRQIHDAKIYFLERDKSLGNPTEIHEIQ